MGSLSLGRNVMMAMGLSMMGEVQSDRLRIIIGVFMMGRCRGMYDILSTSHLWLISL